VDSKESGPDDLKSWDGRKTADFAKVSNDGQWTWDGSDWQPRKITKKQTSKNNQEQQAGVHPDSVQLPNFPSQSKETVNQAPSTDVGTISPDGLHQWDGSKWIPVELTKLSDDGVWMWNGAEWTPAPPTNIPNVVEKLPMLVTQSPMMNRGNGISYIQSLAHKGGKTFYAPLITAGLVFLLMFTPFLIFEHDEMTNSEEDEVCVLIYQSFQSASNDEEFVESDDLECPMNGYASSIYSIETISNFEIDADESSAGANDNLDDESSNGTSDEEERFVVAMLMLFASPFLYILFALLGVLCTWFKKYPIAVGILQLLFVVLFIIVSSGGLISDGSFELSVHGNFAGIGIYLVGFVSIGYLIPK